MNKVQLEAILKLVDVQIDPQVFRKISQAVAGLPVSLQQTSTQLQNATNNAQTLNKTLKGTTNQLSQSERAARLFLQRMAQFAILLPTFATLNHAIQGGVKFLFEFDSALRDIVRTDVSGLSGRMEEIGDAALASATKFGVLAQEVLGVTKIFVQAGLTIEDAQKRADLAITATQVSTLSSADAVEFFIAAANQFKLGNEDLTKSLDALVKVEDLAAVEAKDVAEAFRTGGNSMAQFGKNINDSIGIISALREQTRKSGSEIGTFLKTIQTRIFAAGESRSALEALGVTVENLDGSLRPTLAVLNDLKTRFDKLTEAQQANAAKAIAGVRQFESLIATLNSLQRANELSRDASQAAGTADLKRTVTDEKLERQLGKLIAQGQALAEAFGDSGLESALASALKFATLVLKAFTSLAKVIDDIGGNVTPLLALGGISLGRSVFGFAGRGGQGGGTPGASAAAPAAATESILASKQATQQTIAFGQSLKQNAQIVQKSLIGIGSNLKDFGLILKFEAQNVGFVTRTNIEALKIHTTSLKENISALKANITAIGNKAAGALQSTPGIVLASLGASALPGVFDKLSQSLQNTDTAVGDLGSSFLDTTKNGASLGLQFAIISGKAGLLAGIFGILETSIGTIVNATEEELKAKEELRTALTDAGKELQIFGKLTSQTDVGKKQASGILDLLKETVGGKGPGKDLVAAQNKFFEQLGQQFGVSGDEIAKVFLSKVKTGIERENIASSSVSKLVPDVQIGQTGLEAFIKSQKDVIKARAEETNTLGTFEQLLAGVENGTMNAGEQLHALEMISGTLSIEAARAAKSLEQLKDIREIQGFADSIRTLGQELELAKLGPDALADSVVKMQQELMLAERESANTSARLEQSIADLFQNFDAFSVGLDPAKASAVAFFQSIQAGAKTLDPSKIEEFNKFISDLPAVQQKGAEEVLKILEDQLKEEKSIQDQRNALQAEVNKRQRAMFDQEAEAAINAFESTRKFTSELLKFGDAVNTDVLAAFKNISLDDVKKTLSGTSDLSDGIQQVILSAFGDDKPQTKVIRAQTELNAIQDTTQASLDVLAKKLEDVNRKLGDQANANDIVGLTAKKNAIELDIENATQEGIISTTEAKIKVLTAERDAADAAAAAEKKRLDLLEKLADASRAFAKDLRDSERSFREFQQQKLENLFKEEADAAKELKDAQKEVIDTTKKVAEAYDALIKAQLEFNGVVAEARIKSNLLNRDIGALTGSIFSFDDGLSAIGDAFNSVLNDSNITLGKRIDLERQLAEETLSFLQQARDEIVQAGIGIFGQTGQENQALGQGIAGLQLVADTLGGSFEAFLNLTQGELADVTQTLLSLPAEFRQQILSALSFLPSSTNIGGFSVEQLTQAIGQVGAGVAPEAGLPSIEELNTQQVEQLTKLQELALQDAQIQVEQIVTAQKQLEAAQEAVDAAQIVQERAEQNLIDVRDAVLEEGAVLAAANAQREVLLQAVIAADDRNTLNQIENEAQLFAEQNSTFREIGDNIVRGISAAIGGRLATIEAAANVNNASKGYIPNFASGNLSPREAASLLRAGSREKRSMPAGAGLAVANTSEAIIPMNYRGAIPNFQDGNFSSPIAAGIEAIKQVNQAVVAAIARSITETLANLQTGTGNTDELLSRIIDQLTDLNSTLEDVNASNAVIESNTAATTGTAATPAPTTAGANDVRIVLETNQNSTITIQGLENLRTQIVAAVREAATDQADKQLEPLLESLDNVITTLQERGIISAFGQPK